MVTLVKHEWHSVDSQFAVELDLDLLGEIYPDKEEEELQVILDGVADGTYDVEEIVNDAYENDVEIYWERQYDDWWTDRKGGYEVTYELGDESSWVDNTPPEPTHKCTKCKWTGQGHDAEYIWEDSEGNSYDQPKKVCPMCESDIELTPEGVVKDEEQRKRMAEIDAMFENDDDSN